MFCRNCGNEMNDESELCPNCGWSRNSEVSTKRKSFNLLIVPLSSILAIVLVILLIKYVLYGRDGWRGDSYYKNGKMVTDEWVLDNDKWYYLNNDGKYVKNEWKVLKGDYYYFDVDGAMASNKWVKWYGWDYYVDGEGKMLRNAFTPDGFLVGPDGKWVH